jgi:non-ribosomal peptide synthetase component F
LKEIGDSNLNFPFPLLNFEKNIENKEKNTYFFYLNEEKSKKLKTFVKNGGKTLFITISAIFSIFLNKYFGEKEIVLTYGNNCRPKELPTVIGCFVNVLPLKVIIEKNQSFIDVINFISKKRYEHR